MGLTIHREPQPPKLIRMGQAPVAIESKAENDPVPVVPDAPPEPVKNKRGRPKKMAKDLDEVGTKTIRKDDAGEKGAVGSHGVNAPAQEKQPSGGEAEKNKGDKGNG